MKKNIYRIMTLTLLFVLIIQTVSFASAVSVNWTDATGGHTAGVFNIVGTARTQALSKGYGTASHRQGILGDYLYLYDDVSVTQSATITVTNGSFFYSSYVYQAMDLVGMYASHTATFNAGQMLTIPPDAATGTYVFGIRFDCKNADWLVVDGITIMSADDTATQKVIEQTGSGTISFAPTGSTSLVYILK